SANGIHFTLSRSSSINYRIFDISGRELMSRKTSMLGAGTHSIKIASGSFCPGVYILDFRAGDIFFKGKFSITK
ncbi:MAG TPA: T9SS type A sorting domain-containing protein, partial [Chitinivibrionales bacterium]|nr:T9SS type A sorting domain-containing protein [Chitinivibrionales bacterium]